MRQTIDRVLGRPAAALALFLASLLCGWRGFDYALAAALGNRPTFPFTVNLRTTQYFYSYQDLGFIKRGLVGTLLHPFPVLTTRVGLGVVAWVLLLIFAVVFWRFFISATASVAERGRGVLALVCAAMPGFFIRLGYDFGRFDVIDLTALVAVLACLERSRWLLASIPAALAILVHEDFVVFALPLIAALAYSAMADEPRQRRVLDGAKLLALPGAASLAIAIWGRSRLSLPELMDHFAANRAYLAATPDGQVSLNEVSVLSRTLWDNLRFNGRMFVEKRAAFHLPIILAWFWFVFRYAGNFYRRNGLKRDLAFYAAFSPLLLGLVGFDYYRWVAMAAVNLIFLLILQCRRLARSGAVATIDWDFNAKVLVATGLLGPISNTKSFPYFFMLLDKVLPWHIPW